ncbi:MAG: MATE family efflux transporter [Ilumatobacter sp.]|nr:MATE family efflux transporter [Ilumatobacter sp.]
MNDLDRRVIALALPALGTLAAEPLYRLVDTAVVGRLGTDQLGGLAIAVAILSLVIASSNFITYGTTQRVAHRLGAQHDTEAANVGVQAVWLGAMVGIAAVPVLILGAEPMASALGASNEVLDFAVEYLRIAALSVPFVVVSLAAQGVQRGASDFRTPLIILVCSNIVNVVVELILVFGFDLGIAGAAWSTVVAQVGAGIAFLVVIQCRLKAASQRRPNWPEMLPLLTAGRHLLLRVGSILAVFTGATAIAARIDDATLAAHQIVVTMFLFLALTLDALAVPAQTLVAEELGRVERGVDGADALVLARRVVRLSVIFATGLAVVIAAASPLLARAFSTDGDVISRATSGLLILAVLLLPGAVAFAYDGILIGAADYRFIGRASFAYLLAVAPIAAVVIVTPSLGIVGIWLGLLVWMTLRAIVNHRRTATVLCGKHHAWSDALSAS